MKYTQKQKAPQSIIIVKFTNKISKEHNNWSMLCLKYVITSVILSQFKEHEISVASLMKTLWCIGLVRNVVLFHFVESSCWYLDVHNCIHWQHGVSCILCSHPSVLMENLISNTSSLHKKDEEENNPLCPHMLNKRIKF